MVTAVTAEPMVQQQPSSIAVLTTTPPAISDQIIAICRSIAPAAPAFIDCVPAPGSRPSFCFSNVAEQVKAHGGSIAYGWVIWQIAGLYIEAEHHGVWRSDAGELVDVSPQFGNPPRTLFLADQDAVFDPDNLRQNRFFPDGDTPITIEFATLAQRRVDKLNAHRRADTTEVLLPPALQAEADFIMNRLSALQALHLRGAHDSA
jgi:hypothetical protein